MTMGLADVPPRVLAQSFLMAMQKLRCGAVVICAEQPNGPMNVALSNNGPAAIAAAAQALTVKEGAIDKAAEAIHNMRAQMPTGAELLTDDEKAAFDKCLVCGKAEKFEELDDDTKKFHRAIAEVVTAATAMHTATAGKEESRIVRV